MNTNKETAPAAVNTVTVFDGTDTFEVSGDQAIQDNLKAVLQGKFFKATFVKANGEERELNGRLGVHKHIKGTGKPSPEDSVIVFVPSLDQYRSFKLNRLQSIQCGVIKITGAAA